MAKILLFGAGLQVLSVAWSLKDRHQVEACAEDISVIRRCRSLTRCFKVCLETLPLSTFDGYDLIIPVEEVYAEWLSLHRGSLGAKAAVMDWETFSLASDKTRLMALCEERGFPHPKTRDLEKYSPAEAAAYVGFPALVKPSHGSGARGIHLVHDLSELQAILPSIQAEYGSCALQEFIDGSGEYYNVMLFRCRDGAWGNHAVTRILRYYPVQGGSSSLCITVEEPGLVRMCQEVLEALDWHGFADFDVLEKGSGDFRIIEVNPRIPASIRAAETAGVNFPEMIVSEAIDGTVPTYEYRPGRYLRCLGLDLAWFAHSNRRWKASPSWFRFFRNTVYQDGGWRDFPAMMASLWVGIRKMTDPAFRRKKAGMN
ncbi:MAG: ATP-grasp domain-containing protein [Bacteroidales bacterium]|nr:ATP-grasp domain-containing protein [Bacteroidales bacterium]